MLKPQARLLLAACCCDRRKRSRSWLIRCAGTVSEQARLTSQAALTLCQAMRLTYARRTVHLPTSSPAATSISASFPCQRSSHHLPSGFSRKLPPHFPSKRGLTLGARLPLDNICFYSYVWSITSERSTLATVYYTTEKPTANKKCRRIYYVDSHWA